MLRNLKLLLFLFENASGLNINFSKSEAFWLGGNLANQVEIAGIFNCKKGSFPFNYLGIPITLGRMKNRDWFPLIDKVEKKLPCWKGYTLSRGGRLTLINSVLSSIPSYWMSYFFLPCWVVDRIDQIIRAFF